MNLRASIALALLRVTASTYRSACRRYMNVTDPSVRMGVCTALEPSRSLALRICVRKFSAISRLGEAAARERGRQAARTRTHAGAEGGQPRGVGKRGRDCPHRPMRHPLVQQSNRPAQGHSVPDVKRREEQASPLRSAIEAPSLTPRHPCTCAPTGCLPAGSESILPSTPTPSRCCRAPARPPRSGAPSCEGRALWCGGALLFKGAGRLAVRTAAGGQASDAGPSSHPVPSGPGCKAQLPAQPAVGVGEGGRKLLPRREGRGRPDHPAGFCTKGGGGGKQGCACGCAG